MNSPMQRLSLLFTALIVAGCGDHAAEVTGRVTCQGKPVTGSILFSPKGDNESNKGPAVQAALDEEGNYRLRLKTTGTHTIVVTPRNVKFPVRAGEVDYPCDRSPVQREVEAGVNDITIELAPRDR